MKTDAHHRLAYQRDIGSYLSELSSLAGSQVTEHQLSKVEDVAAVLGKSNMLANAPRSSVEILFADKGQAEDVRS